MAEFKGESEPYTTFIDSHVRVSFYRSKWRDKREVAILQPLHTLQFRIILQHLFNLANKVKLFVLIVLLHLFQSHQRHLGFKFAYFLPSNHRINEMGLIVSSPHKPQISIVAYQPVGSTLVNINIEHMFARECISFCPKTESIVKDMLFVLLFHTGQFIFFFLFRILALRYKPLLLIALFFYSFIYIVFLPRAAVFITCFQIIKERLKQFTSTFRVIITRNLRSYQFHYFAFRQQNSVYTVILKILACGVVLFVTSRINKKHFNIFCLRIILSIVLRIHLNDFTHPIYPGNKVGILTGETDNTQAILQQRDSHQLHESLVLGWIIVIIFLSNDIFPVLVTVKAARFMFEVYAAMKFDYHLTHVAKR